MAIVKVLPDGPCLVEGDVKLIDWKGREYAIPKRPFALCRCGASANRPFCDGTHATIHFAAAEGASEQRALKPRSAVDASSLK